MGVCRRCLRCAVTWVIWGVSISAPGRVGACLEEVEGAEEALQDAGHVLLHEVGVVLGGGVWAWPQQRHEAGCHHVRPGL